MAQATTLDAPDQGTRTIGFFTLSRELRDDIYDMIYQDETEDMDGVRFRFQGSIPKARLISREFKSEYDERSKKIGILQISGTWRTSSEGTKIPQMAVRSAGLVLRLWSPACDCMQSQCLSAQRLEAQVDCYARFIARLPKFRIVRMKLFVYPSPCLKSMVEALLKLPQLFSLDIEALHQWQVGVSVRIAQWTRDQGFLMDVTDIASSFELLEAALRRKKAAEDAAKLKAKSAGHKETLAKAKAKSACVKLA